MLRSWYSVRRTSLEQKAASWFWRRRGNDAHALLCGLAGAGPERERRGEDERSYRWDDERVSRSAFRVAYVVQYNRYDCRDARNGACERFGFCGGARVFRLGEHENGQRRPFRRRDERHPRTWGCSERATE